jgi:tRNA dimethylallyltransferase
LRLAETFRGEIVACDSTAVYRGIDIGTDKVAIEEQRGIPHHLVDVVGPTDRYSAADYSRDASAVVGAILERGRVPVVVGGTGLYYRALVRGMFPGPARDEHLRARLSNVARRRGVDALHRWLGRVDPASARRIQPRDEKRLVRALEVYMLTGRPLTDHFEETTSPIAGVDVLTIGLSMPRPWLRERVARRVDAQVSRGVVVEVESLLASGVPASAHAFSGLVYRQIVGMLRGERDLDATRELIVRENMRYARRQLIWFRKEPNVRWLDGPGESEATVTEAKRVVAEFLAHSTSRQCPEASID